MRKIMILSAAALAIFLAMPQLAEATTITNATTVIQEKAVKYQEVAPATLPEAITKALAKDYAGYTVEKAFLGDDGTFKVAVSKADAKNAVFFSATGDFIKIEKIAPEKKAM
jgi:hypothetical protein